MKILPCKSLGCKQKSYIAGGVYYVSRFPDTYKGGPYTYKCNKCGANNTLTRDEYRYLPTIETSDLPTHGIYNWETLGLTPSQSADCLLAGFSLDDIRKEFRR